MNCGFNFSGDPVIGYLLSKATESCLLSSKYCFYCSTYSFQTSSFNVSSQIVAQCSRLLVVSKKDLIHHVCPALTPHGFSMCPCIHICIYNGRYVGHWYACTDACIHDSCMCLHSHTNTYLPTYIYPFILIYVCLNTSIHSCISS